MKIWDAHQKGLIDSLFGHRDQMFSISILDEEKLVSTSFDRRPIVWKIEQESQMIYNERGLSLDCVTALNKYHFITGGEDGEICVWNVSEKKPRLVIENAHQKGWISCL